MWDICVVALGWPASSFFVGVLSSPGFTGGTSSSVPGPLNGHPDLEKAPTAVGVSAGGCIGLLFCSCKSKFSIRCRSASVC